MRRAIQRALLRGYRAARSSGLLDTRIGRYAADRVYGLYKDWLEREAKGLQAYVPPGSQVADVGANVGYYTLKFARWVGPRGRVVAVEPEPANCARLREALAAAKLAERVRVVQAAAAEEAKPLFLALNADNPADHRLGASGLPVQGVRLDDVLGEDDLPLSLVKIDVQGAESRVLAGARESLARWRPAVFLEIDDSALRQADSSADELIDALCGLGYRMYELESGRARSLARANVATRCADMGYADFLFLHPEGSRP